MAYIGNGPGVASQRILTTLTATEGQTSFTPSAGYTLGYVDVFLNGVKLIDGTDYAAADGVSIVLTEAATLDDTVEVVAYFPRGLSDGYTKAEADARYMDINEETLPDQAGHSGQYLQTDGTNADWATVTAPTPTSVSDQDNTSTGYFDMPAGTSAQRPASPNPGYTRLNTTLDSLEFYNGSNWVPTNLTPSISVSGSVWDTSTSPSLVVTTSNTTDSVTFFVVDSNETVLVQEEFSPVNNQFTFKPSTLDVSWAGLVAPGDILGIYVTNVDGTESNRVSKTVYKPPSGAAVSAYPLAGQTDDTDGYRYHTFTTSGTFTVDSGSLPIEYIVIAGGGSGSKAHSTNTCGGGGAGGYRSSVVGESSGGGASAEARLTLGPGTYAVTVGAGGTCSTATGNQTGTNGTNSAFHTITSLGGGFGAIHVGSAGGSGGGAGSWDATTTAQAGGAGTAGQGYGGGASNGVEGHAGCGGGGAGGAGQSCASNARTVGAAGGVGVASSITSTSTHRAGGGGSSGWGGSNGGLGGTGGGGNGQYGSGNGQNGGANTGGGGGGSKSAVNAGNGGSGVVYLRYRVAEATV